MLKTHTQEIDGLVYETKTFPATEGLVLLPRLIALLGEQVFNLVFATNEEQMGGLMADPTVMGAIMVRIAERAAENDGLLVCKDLLKYTTCDKVQIGDGVFPSSVHTHFDNHFAGNYGHLLKVCAWVARATFVNP